MKGLSGRHLEALQVDAMSSLELNVAFREILADDADELYRPEETRRHSGMDGRPAEKARVFAVGRPDGIQGGGTDNENAHFSVNR